MRGDVRPIPRPCPRFVSSRLELDELLREAKQHGCPHCFRCGTLIGHGLIVGYAELGSERVVRGRRFLCSRRHRRSGCGRTWSVRLGDVMAGFCARTHVLSRLLSAVVLGAGFGVAWTALTTGLSVRSGYRLWRRLLAAQSHLRTMLYSMSPPPSCTSPRHVDQLLSHLEHALGTSTCPFARFQVVFQRHLLG